MYSMYTGKIALTNPREVPLSLTNDFHDTFGLKEDVAFVDTIEELLETVNEHSFYRKWSVARETPKYTRLKSTDNLDNIHYLLIYKQ